jgi:hypothetical protein
MGVFWPTATSGNPSVLGRAGRVLHWLSLAFGALWLAIGVYAGLTSESLQAGAWGFGLGAAAFLVSALLGRALRYVLSAE